MCIDHVKRYEITKYILTISMNSRGIYRYHTTSILSSAKIKKFVFSLSLFFNTNYSTMVHVLTAEKNLFFPKTVVNYSTVFQKLRWCRREHSISKKRSKKVHRFSKNSSKKIEFCFLKRFSKSSRKKCCLFFCCVLENGGKMFFSCFFCKNSGITFLSFSRKKTDFFFCCSHLHHRTTVLALTSTFI